MMLLGWEFTQKSVALDVHGGREYFGILSLFTLGKIQLPVFEEKNIKMPKDIIDIEATLRKHYLNDSNRSESETCGLNLYPHGSLKLLGLMCFGVLN